MNDPRIRKSLETYVAAWNERDAARRGELVARACSDDLRLVTSGRVVRGRAELDAMIADFQRRCPGDCAVFAGTIDVQGRLFRFAGRVVGTNGEVRGDAFDAGECDAEGRIALLLTFVGATLPSAPPDA